VDDFNRNITMKVYNSTSSLPGMINTFNSSKVVYFQEELRDNLIEPLWDNINSVVWDKAKRDVRDA
jgi:hypothetical protein